MYLFLNYDTLSGTWLAFAKCLLNRIMFDDLWQKCSFQFSTNRDESEKKKKNPEYLPRHLFKQAKISFFPFHNHMSEDIPLFKVRYLLFIRFIQQNFSRDLIK